jgi:bacterioferritin (cytochrome b1)
MIKIAAPVGFLSFILGPCVACSLLYEVFQGGYSTEVNMHSSHSWIQRWRGFFGLSMENKPLEILRRLYVEESKHAALFAQHALGVQYPQFRAKLEKIAIREAAHVDSIGKQIKLLGGSLPVLRPSKPVTGNSWEILRAALEDESRFAGELLEYAARLEGDFPEVADLLRRIHADEQKHREEIQEMLMRSDPFSIRAA